MLRQEQFKALSNFGITQADCLVLEYLSIWVNENKRKNKGKNYRDGRYWTFNSYEAITDYFGGIISCSTVRNSLTRLIEVGLIIKGNYNDCHFDRTGWYTLSDEAERILLKSEKTEPAPTVENPKKEEQPKSRLPYEYDIEFRKRVGHFFKEHPEADPDGFINYCYQKSQSNKVKNPRAIFSLMIVDRSHLADYMAIQNRDRMNEERLKSTYVPTAIPERTAEEEELIDRAFADLQEKFRGANNGL